MLHDFELVVFNQCNPDGLVVVLYFQIYISKSKFLVLAQLNDSTNTPSESLQRLEHLPPAHNACHRPRRPPHCLIDITFSSGLGSCNASIAQECN